MFLDENQSKDVQMTETSSSASSSGMIAPQQLTAFPGHEKKKNRISYFSTSDMDKYVQKFTPAQTSVAPTSSTPHRRHSMFASRPPLSRMNRFSLDSISEIVSNGAQLASPAPLNAPSDRDESEIDQQDEEESPKYPRIRWQIPNLIPIRFNGVSQTGAFQI